MLIRQHAVGDLACALVPGGVMVEIDPDMQAALTRTAELVAAADRPIFEATFAHDGVLVRVDILIPHRKHNGTVWDIAEVKSSGSAKDYHKGDLATQLWVIRQNGLNVASAAIRHIDTSFVLQTVGNYDGIFTDTSLLEEIGDVADGRAKIVGEIREMLSGDEPFCATGEHCSSPFSCEFINHCSLDESAKPEWPIAELPNSGRKLADKWSEKGITDIRDLPEDNGLNSLHTRIWQSLVGGEPYRDAGGAKADTANWAYPWIWLDFETIAFAIPKWVGTKPYSQIPFQYSAHIETRDGSISHIEALDLSGDDPRAAIAASLAQLPASGTVIAWNAGFERRCLRDLAAAIPEHAEALLSLADRTVDLLPVTKANYYHPDQRGSFSIKAVLPTLLPELDYSALEVKDGGNAQLAYFEAVDPDCTPERRQAIRAALEAYCERDTWAMVAIYRSLIGETA
ncbi:DUF2779 domain-containing protein [Parasphingorhabdus sp.]|uniref:DUF2779 domain-containing protein n=1 Tax=Parasphingorhabdus sp. TaxID=2709688 RepID=UPI002F92777D